MRNGAVGPIAAAQASAALSLLLLAACGPSERGPGTTFSDSAGVTLATAETPAWGPGEGWRVADEPTGEIGVWEMDGS